eukprot:GHRR01027858.1.p1 GENE.GHRR01027858.1~~GHRR01027858.1.p1  ORF type:complete len:104 (-),score=14.90 GHRR01027858.1:549-860(-)
MVVLEGAVTNDQQLEDIGLLLECLEGELDAARNFDMVQALLARILVVSAGQPACSPSCVHNCPMLLHSVNHMFGCVHECVDGQWWPLCCSHYACTSGLCCLVS